MKLFTPVTRTVEPGGMADVADISRKARDDCRLSVLQTWTSKRG